MADKLTERQKRFVREYLASGNATDAARNAGYATPNKTGPKLVKTGLVAAAIAEGAKRAERASIAGREERLEILTKLVRGEDELSGEVVKPSDRISAASLISKMQGELITKVAGPEGENLKVDITTVSTGDLLAMIKELRRR